MRSIVAMAPLAIPLHIRGSSRKLLSSVWQGVAERDYDHHRDDRFLRHVVGRRSAPQRRPEWVCPVRSGGPAGVRSSARTISAGWMGCKKVVQCKHYLGIRVTLPGEKTEAGAPAAKVGSFAA